MFSFPFSFSFSCSLFWGRELGWWRVVSDSLGSYVVKALEIMVIYLYLFLQSSDKPSTPLILAGLVFRYFVATNCGLITHLLSRVNHIKSLDEATNKSDAITYVMEDVASSLSKHAVNLLEQNAISRGHLSGCNCIFLQIAVEGRDDLQILTNGVVDTRKRHKWLYNLGWRLLDVDYFAPPRIFPEDSRPARHSLCVLLTQRIPRYPIVSVDDQIYHYVPQPLVTTFLRHMWKLECQKFGVLPEKVLFFRRMMDLVVRRKFIPLLNLPWERPWTIIDLYECNDVSLLYTFYHAYTLWQISYRQQRESLAAWVNLLTHDDRDSLQPEILHIALALTYPKDSKTIRPSIVGAAIMKYFNRNNCALVTHLITSGNYDARMLMGDALLEEVIENVEVNAIEGGQIAGCNAFFMELPTKAIKQKLVEELDSGKVVEDEDAPLGVPAFLTSKQPTDSPRITSSNVSPQTSGANGSPVLAGVSDIQDTIGDSANQDGETSVVVGSPQETITETKSVPLVRVKSMPVMRVGGDEAEEALHSAYELLSSSGWYKVALDNYVAPPQMSDWWATSTSDPEEVWKGNKMNLFVKITSQIPRDEEGKPCLTADIIRNFIQVYWQTTCERIGKSLDIDTDYQAMLEHLQTLKTVSLIDMRQSQE